MSWVFKILPPQKKAGQLEFINHQAEPSLRHPKLQQLAKHIFRDPLPGYHGRRSCQIGAEGLTSFINCFLKRSHQLHLHHAYSPHKKMSPNTKARITQGPYTVHPYRSSWYLVPRPSTVKSATNSKTSTSCCTNCTNQLPIFRISQIADVSGLRAVEGEEELWKGPAAQRPAHFRRTRRTTARRLG